MWIAKSVPKLWSRSSETYTKFLYVSTLFCSLKYATIRCTLLCYYSNVFFYLYRSHFTKCRKWNTACLISLLHISCGGRSSYHSELFLQVIFPTFNFIIFSLALSYCWRSSLRTLTFACPYEEQYAFLFQLLSSLFIRYSLLFSDYVSEFQFSLY